MNRLTRSKSFKLLECGQFYFFFSVITQIFIFLVDAGSHLTLRTLCRLPCASALRFLFHHNISGLAFGVLFFVYSPIWHYFFLFVVLGGNHLFYLFHFAHARGDVVTFHVIQERTVDPV